MFCMKLQARVIDSWTLNFFALLYLRHNRHSKSVERDSFRSILSKLHIRSSLRDTQERPSRARATIATVHPVFSSFFFYASLMSVNLPTVYTASHS